MLRVKFRVEGLGLRVVGRSKYNWDRVLSNNLLQLTFQFILASPLGFRGSACMCPKRLAIVTMVLRSSSICALASSENLRFVSQHMIIH